MLRGQVCRALAVLAATGTVHAATPLWWDTDYARRFNVAVTTGPSAPDRGYAGYTVRIAPLDTQSLVAAGELQSDCADLRITYYDGIAWQDLPRHVIGCNSADTDIRFALPADIASGATDDNYYLYYANAAAGTAPPMSEDNVYLWFDDASTDRSAAYIRGRIDNWHGTGWDDSLGWNAGGYYVYDNGDNFTSGYRRNMTNGTSTLKPSFFTPAVIHSTSRPASCCAAQMSLAVRAAKVPIPTTPAIGASTRVAPRPATHTTVTSCPATARRRPSTAPIRPILLPTCGAARLSPPG